jgi:hypothetical protein
VALKLAPECVDGQRVRKLWTARLLFVLSAAGLGAVVVEERREQDAEAESLETICWSELETSRDGAGAQSRSRACTETRSVGASSGR